MKANAILDELDCSSSDKLENITVHDLLVIIEAMSYSRKVKGDPVLSSEVAELVCAVNILSINVRNLYESVKDLNCLLNAEQGGFIDTLQYP